MKKRMREKIEYGMNTVPPDWTRFERNSYPEWVRYEHQGDIALIKHKGKKALKLYDKALYELGIYGENITPTKWRELHEKRSQQYERIKRKRDRIEASLSGKRKFLSGKVSEHNREKGLVSKVGGILGIIALGLAVVFAYPKVTGNVIGNLTMATSNVLALILFLTGIVGLFIFFKFK